MHNAQSIRIDQMCAPMQESIKITYSAEGALGVHGFGDVGERFVLPEGYSSDVILDDPHAEQLIVTGFFQG